MLGPFSVEHANIPRTSSLSPHPQDKEYSFAFRELSLIEHFPTSLFKNAANVCGLAITTFASEEASTFESCCCIKTIYQKSTVKH